LLFLEGAVVVEADVEVTGGVVICGLTVATAVGVLFVGVEGEIIKGGIKVDCGIGCADCCAGRLTMVIVGTAGGVRTADDFELVFPSFLE